jgi:hypothetical protein
LIDLPGQWPLWHDDVAGRRSGLVALSEEDVERLASRLAMMVSEDGEAENAGRAMGQLARRLGLTGGELKEMFLAGAAASAAEPRNGGVRSDAARMEREIAILRKALRESESKLTSAERERDTLHRDVIALHDSLRRARGASQSRLAIVAIIALAVGAAAIVSFVVSPNTLQTLAGLSDTPPAPVAADAGMEIHRMAVVRASRATVFAQPDRAAQVLATLPAGMPVVVRRLVWNMLMQWAEVELGSGVGYVLTTDIDLS